MQERFGYVHDDAVALVAETFNVSRADVHGVLTYYHDLRTTPAPTRCIQICVAEACQSVGSRELVAAVEKKLGKKIDESNSDVEIKSAYCFGNCALGPAAMVDGELVGRASVEKVTA
jgi:formate dehydrogenase subunit gamma